MQTRFKSIYSMNDRVQKIWGNVLAVYDNYVANQLVCSSMTFQDSICRGINVVTSYFKIGVIVTNFGWYHRKPFTNGSAINKTTANLFYFSKRKQGLYFIYFICAEQSKIIHRADLIFRQFFGKCTSYDKLIWTRSLLPVNQMRSDF